MACVGLACPEASTALYVVSMQSATIQDTKKDCNHSLPNRARDCHTLIALSCWLSCYPCVGPASCLQVALDPKGAYEIFIQDNSTTGSHLVNVSFGFYQPHDPGQCVNFCEVAVISLLHDLKRQHWCFMNSTSSWYGNNLFAVELKAYHCWCSSFRMQSSCTHSDTLTEWGMVACSLFLSTSTISGCCSQATSSISQHGMLNM